MSQPSPSTHETAPCGDVPESFVASRRLIRHCGVAFTFTVAALFAVNLLGNGAGLLPSPWFPCHSDRSWKARRLEEAVRDNRSPEALLFGSSYVMKFQPAYVERLTGLRTFNCGVSMGRPIDSLVQLRHALRNGVQPKLVIAAYHQEAFEPGLAEGTVQLADYLGLLTEAPPSTALRVIARKLANARIWDTRASVRNLVRGAPPYSRSVKDVDSVLLDDGYLIYTRDTLARHQGTFDLAARIRKAIEATDHQADDPSRAPAKEQLESLRSFVRLAQGAGARVILVLMPKHPDAWQTTQRLTRQRLDEELKSLTEPLNIEYHNLVDLDSYHGDPNEFYDAGHQTVVNTRQILNYLLSSEDDPSHGPLPSDWDLLQQLPARTTLTLP